MHSFPIFILLKKKSKKKITVSSPTKPLSVNFLTKSSNPD